MTSHNLYGIAYDLDGQQKAVKDALKAAGFRETADGSLGHATPLPDTLLIFEATSEAAVEAAFNLAIRQVMFPPVVTKLAIMKLAASPVVKARDDASLVGDFLRAQRASKG